MAVDTETTQTETTGTGEVDHFSGDEPTPDIGGDETESEQTPEPAETESETAGETEGGEEAETTDEAEGSETAEESGDDWLPTEQEKQFPLETLVKYAEKRGYKWTADQIAKDGDLQKLLKDKLNSDIFIQKSQNEQQDDSGAELDENQFDETAEPEVAAEPVATTQTDPKKAYYESIESIVSTQLDPASINELGKGLLDAFGVNTDTQKLQQMLANPKLSPEERAETQGALALAQNAGKIGQVIARGGVDLVKTVLPRLLPELIEQIYPGTQKRYEMGVYADAWQKVTSAVGKDGKPIYSNLPAYGSKEFREMAFKAERQLGLPQGGLRHLVIKDSNGTPVPLEQQAQAKYRMIAKVSQGQKISPQTVAAAVQTGKRQATEIAQKRAAGRAMGAGQTSKGLNQPDTDDVLSELETQIRRTNDTWDTPMKKKS
jgi:hypothetical protein